MKKFLVLAAALLAFAFTAQTAQAEPEHELVFGEITVEVHGGGTVTGTGINCGADCYDDDSWYDNQLPPTNRLTATAGRGWAFGGWEGCTSVNGQSNKCDAGYQEFGAAPIIASFYDVMAPSVFLQHPAVNTVANQTLHAAVESGDNDRVSKVEYLIDGQVVKTVESGGIDVYIDISGVVDGQHQIEARAYDPTGNYGITAARSFTVDHTAPDVTFNAPVAATNAESPTFSFSSTATDIQSAWCSIVMKGQAEDYEACSPNDPFVAPGAAEGEWQVKVQLTDGVGNVTEATHDFVVDRTAPVADFTSGPVDGATVKPGEVSYGWSANDGLGIAHSCSWDGAESVGCESPASKTLEAGAHNFKVTIVDQAGNETTLSRSVTVKTETGTDPDPDPGNDPGKPDPGKPDPGKPGTNDKTAPAVKLLAPKQTLKTLRKALRLRVSCDESCSGKVVVKGAGLKFSGRVSLTGAGVAKLKLRPTAKVRQRIAVISTHNLPARKLKLTARASLSDQAGNAGRATLKFRVAG